MNGIAYAGAVGITFAKLELAEGERPIQELPCIRQLILNWEPCVERFQDSSFPFDLMKRTREQVADTIEAFVNGTGRQWDWDGFISIRLDDPELEAVRLRCVSLPVEFPPATRAEYCSAAGLQLMREVIQSLRSHSEGTPAS